MSRFLNSLTIMLFMLSVSVYSQHELRHYTVEDGLSNNQIRQLIELPNGQILVGTEGSFGLFNGKEFVSLRCRHDSLYRLPRFGSHAHLWNGDSILWLKDYYNLYKFNVSRRIFTYDYGKISTNGSLYQFIHEDGDSAKYSYLRSIESNRDRFSTILSSFGIENEQLQSYLKDRDGGEWYGSLNSGVFYNPKHSSHIRLLNVGNDLVRHIALADSSHLLLCSSHGIYLYDYKRSGELRSLAEGELMCTDVTTDKWGDIWIASRDGIFRYSNGELSHYNHTNSSGLIHDNMRFAVRIDSTRLLVCNFMHHLGIFDLPTRSMHILNDSIPSLSSYRIMVSGLLSSDNRNAIICTQNGSFNLDIEQRQIDSIKAISPYRQYSNKFNCCYSDSRKRIWLGTQNGLLVFDSLRCHRLSESDGLSNSCIQSLAEDRYGNIWVGTSMGLNRIHIDNDSLFSIRIIDKSDGLPSSELMERCMCITPDGRLYLSTLDGLVEVDASQFVEPVDPPKVTLVSFTVGEKEMRCDSSGISLPYNENYVELKVSCLHYSHNSHTRYRYRMLGIDDDWHLSSDIGSLSVIRFNALPAGDYTFEVCASNGDDLWGHVFRKEIRIRPPFWLSWWAKLLYAVSALVVLLVSGRIYLRYRQKKIQKENEEKINRLFELRSEARHQFATSVNISPDKIGVNLEEESLVKKMIEAISANMDNVDYSVNMLASDICMSRANLYKKMQTMLGITPNEFMRNIRLKHAAQLLSSTDIPVNQISLQVGFQTPRYFSQCFKSLFGLTPSEYRNGK